MFPRQGIGIGNPFQQYGGINPLQQAALASLLQPSPVGVNPFLTGAALSGVNPMVSQVGGFGVSPLPFAQTSGLGTINPFLTPQLAGAINPATLPMVASQLSTVNPALLAGAIPHMTGAEFGGQFGGQALWGQPFGGPTVGTQVGQFPYHQWGAGMSGGFGQPGQQGFGAVNPNILAQVLANPAIASDPVIGPLLAQQLNPLAQQQLPIRPLIGGQQFHPYQGIGQGITGGFAGQGIDPYAALLQAQLVSQLTQNPYQQAFRSFTGSPWGAGAGSPFGFGQPSPFGQGFGI